MGAVTFFCTAKGKTASDAFTNAREYALQSYGNEGYTGSIAEKSKFTVIPVPENIDPQVFAEELIDRDDSRVSDKWGPAGCIRMNDTTFLFFGWASC
jgi:hypothetical protein